MNRWRIVIDTNVVISGVRSSRGASFRLLRLIGSGSFEHVVSVPLALEYEALLRGVAMEGLILGSHAELLLDYLCHAGIRQKIFYLWRSTLPDAKDDMILELAVAAGCNVIVTFNKSDFSGVETFGLRVMSPREFLELLWALP